MKYISLIVFIAFGFIFSNQNISSVEKNKFKAHMHFGVFVNEDPKISFPVIIKKDDYSFTSTLFPNRRGTMILSSIGCELYEGRSNAFLVELFIHPRVYISDKVTFIYGVGGYTKFKEDDIIERSLAYSVGFDYKVNDTVNFIYRVYLQGVEPDITKSESEGGVVSDFSVIFKL